MESEGFRLAALIDEGEVRAVAGYRIMTMLYCGRLLYVDDLVVDERVRSRGYGRRLLDWLKEEGRRAGCSSLQPVSRAVREQAHRFTSARAEASHALMKALLVAVVERGLSDLVVLRDITEPNQRLGSFSQVSSSSDMVRQFANGIGPVSGRRSDVLPGRTLASSPALPGATGLCTS